VIAKEGEEEMLGLPLRQKCGSATGPFSGRSVLKYGTPIKKAGHESWTERGGENSGVGLPAGFKLQPGPIGRTLDCRFVLNPAKLSASFPPFRYS
jgi:hypothetical protein